MCRARSEHRNTTTSAQSSGVARRPTAVSSTAFSRTSGGRERTISVCTIPGATTFTLTLNLPSSRASVLLIETTPPLDAA
ncbi:MAG: hypothetical protein A2V63_10130 [Candidatus Eisenbacteria bacterium RBG_19FT_COMBO_70_11]|nr:MAG: hypothetical protein A2V63_10130 [Candidatus Eisenbacteria bacterium RBG_19FT_COMBO_70_11]